MKRVGTGIAALLLAAAPAGAQTVGWEKASLGTIEGLVDLRASPHTDSGLVARIENADGGGWRALAYDAESDSVSEAGEAPFMGRLDPPEIIPDGRVGVAPGAPPPEDSEAATGTPTAAWYENGTQRYRHGALGDEIEGGSLQVAYADRRIHGLRLGDTAVFEDLEPRIVDADGDGAAHEILTIRSTLSGGAGLALYSLDPESGRLVERALSAQIGTPNRWLNIAGVADYDNDGTPEIAVVETPHLDGILIHYVWDKARGALVEERRITGYSNHADGSTVQGLSATLDWDGDGTPELLLPKRERRLLAVVGIDADGAFTERAILPNPAPVAASLVVADLGKDGRPEMVYGLADGSIRVLRRQE